MANRKSPIKINSKKFAEDQLEVWHSLNRIVEIQKRTLGVIEKFLDFPKTLLKGMLIGLILGIVATIGLKLWLQATPDSRLNSYTILLVFLAGVIVKWLLDKIRNKEE